MTQKETTRYDRGWQKLAEVDSEAGARVIKSLEEIVPDLARYIIEFTSGDIYTLPGLDLKSREIATVAALTALGNAQLKVHLYSALNVGYSREEVIEIGLFLAKRLPFTLGEGERISAVSQRGSQNCRDFTLKPKN